MIRISKIKLLISRN